MATNFLYATGTNGFIVTPYTDSTLNTAISSLASTNTATSGALSQTNNSSAIWAEIAFKSGGAWTPSSSIIPTMSGWFLHSFDGGSTYELATANIEMPRPADFVIPFTGGTALASGNYSFATGYVRLPPDSFKIFIRNNAGATTSASCTLTVGPFAIQY